MRSCRLLAAVLALCAGEAHASAAGPSEVHVLNKESHANFLQSHNVTLVEYFAPWCGHCQRLEPEYKKAAELLKETGIKLAHVNCVDNKELCEAQNIRGYPTLKIFTQGREAEYDGPRDASGIVKYMKRQIMPAVSELKPNELETLAKSEDVLLVGIFAPGSKEEAEYRRAAEALRLEHTFATIKPGVYMFKKFDEGFATYTGDLTEAALSKWIATESTPLMAEVSPENYAKYMAAGLPMAYLFYEKEPMRREYGAIVEDVMRAHKGRINAVYIDAERFEAHGRALMLPKQWPGFVIHEMEGDLKYPFTGKLTKEELGKFVEAFVSGKLEPSYRSEDVPASDSGPVKTVVFKTFEKVVLDPSKDVLLELYAPWCGACKRIAPTYEALGKTFAPHSDKIVIAKMDGTANDLPKSANIKLTKFPTIILFKAGAKKEQVELERAGDSVQAFVDFITKHATNKVADVKIVEPSAADGSGKHDKDEL